MKMDRPVVAIAGATFAGLVLCQTARADLLINVDKTAQRMQVAVDGRPVYDWPVSTGRSGYNTPSGTFRPFRMDIDHRSQEWDDAPMPYSIFFKGGTAVHGTYEQNNLGHAVSHGCVRLSVANAATLWNLVKQEDLANTTVVVEGSIPSATPPIIADARPTVLAAAPSVSTLPAATNARPALLAPVPPTFAPPAAANSAPIVLTPAPQASSPPPIANSRSAAITPASPVSARPRMANSGPMVLVPPVNIGGRAPAPQKQPLDGPGRRRGSLFSLFGG